MFICGLGSSCLLLTALRDCGDRTMPWRGWVPTACLHKGLGPVPSPCLRLHSLPEPRLVGGGEWGRNSWEGPNSQAAPTTSPVPHPDKRPGPLPASFVSVTLRASPESPSCAAGFTACFELLFRPLPFLSASSLSGIPPHVNIPSLLQICSFFLFKTVLYFVS